MHGHPCLSPSTGRSWYWQDVWTDSTWVLSEEKGTCEWLKSIKIWVTGQHQKVWSLSRWILPSLPRSPAGPARWALNRPASPPRSRPSPASACRPSSASGWRRSRDYIRFTASGSPTITTVLHHSLLVLLIWNRHLSSDWHVLSVWMMSEQRGKGCMSLRGCRAAWDDLTIRDHACPPAAAEKHLWYKFS